MFSEAQKNWHEEKIDITPTFDFIEQVFYT